jgi:DNA-binding response OmpR family regulator
MTVVREARRLQPNILTLIITGHTSGYPIGDLTEEGTADIMFKAFHMTELSTRLALFKRRRDLIDRLHQEKTPETRVPQDRVSTIRHP